MNEKLLYAVIGVAILHNGKRYEVGDTLELTQEEAENIALYVELTESAKEKLAQQQRQAEEEKRQAEEAQRKKEEKQRKSNTDKNTDETTA
ncbi:hypothetical protein CEP48_03190 [Mergibacter septicus]|uniref:DUF7210 domain-containing protein n=1 Tax=Mergibacter septicus TaxID=221402 RepID=A0A8E3MFP9_9PAST|nr:DUF1682 domain-containing protein [Mergibacter septicus]AWX15229.1 hypothetical protein CEP47_03190 [Mergibacter septicus]QDJ14483.1 hypothetical protein CEP48_03190 [Mergibacter septicus]UTU48080.1 hypothetical protein HLL31_04430 [Mergibacter septicus]WMR96308.1 DUF1682 domain-containing protein [Mergibacter septicus]